MSHVLTCKFPGAAGHGFIHVTDDGASSVYYRVAPMSEADAALATHAHAARHTPTNGVAPLIAESIELDWTPPDLSGNERYKSTQTFQKSFSAEWTTEHVAIVVPEPEPVE